MDKKMKFNGAVICSCNKIVYVKEGYSLCTNYDIEGVENELLQKLNFLEPFDEHEIK